MNQLDHPPQSLTMEPEHDGFETESLFPESDLQVSILNFRGV